MIETSPTTRRGRRPSSSREAIEDAAGELFLENTYSRTTIEQITARAGVSRASFFNYFDAKSDLLWGDVDALIDDIAARLATAATVSSPAPPPAAVSASSVCEHSVTGRSGTSGMPTTSPMAIACAVVVDAASVISVDRIPLAVTQWDVMGARADLLASGLGRFDRLASVLRRFLGERYPAAEVVQIDAAALALVGAAAAGAARWTSAGVRRGELAPVISLAVMPVCCGFEAVLG